MKNGFLKVAAATPEIRVADCVYNASQIIASIESAAAQGVRMLVLPELCVTAYTCGDLFFQPTLLRGAEDAVALILEKTAQIDMLCVLGVPVRKGAKLYNCAAVMHKGTLLGIVPKQWLPQAQQRWFSVGNTDVDSILYAGQDTVFGAGILFECDTMPGLTIAAELGEDLWAVMPPSAQLAPAGATLIANPSGGAEVIGRADFLRTLTAAHSAKLVCGYVTASAGAGESTTDFIFGAQNLIAENGEILAESRFDDALLISEIDIERLLYDRRRSSVYPQEDSAEYITIPFELFPAETKLTRTVAASPFMPKESERYTRCEEIIRLSASGLCKRLQHTHAKTAVIGLSGGLDSTLALLITAEAMRMLSRPMTDIIAVTMPCFGTTKRTRSNAVILAERIGAELRTVDITASVRQHFADIGHKEANHDVTYENAQARERTQVIMDIANMTGGMVIGTGDLSELALGWATYNGDHMSMYAVNASIPKTLIRQLVAHISAKYRVSDASLADVLDDILATPVSPELLPAVEGEISQKTEDLVGPYELHDFYLYYILRWAFTPEKILRLAEYALGAQYDRETMLKWLKIFYRRFFAQQFKRSCLPDGPKVGSVGISPRGDWQMPSDACWALWQSELETL